MSRREFLRVINVHNRMTIVGFVEPDLIISYLIMQRLKEMRKKYLVHMNFLIIQLNDNDYSRYASEVACFPAINVYHKGILIDTIDVKLNKNELMNRMKEFIIN